MVKIEVVDYSESRTVALRLFVLCALCFLFGQFALTISKKQR